MLFWEGVTFGAGVIVAGIATYMLFVLIPGKPKKTKIDSVRTGKWE